jgi:gamma-glutamylcysteine synthetase
MGGHKVLDLARELVSTSSEGLARIAAAGFSQHDERRFLDPLHEQIAKGRSPGEEIAESWRGEWGRNRERLIAATRY